MSGFSTNIKKLRAEREMSQEEMAAVIGVTRLTISNYEQGRREPDFDTLCRFADYFDCTTDYLLGRAQMRNSDDGTKLEGRVRDLIYAMQELPIDEREYLTLLLLDILKGYRTLSPVPEYRKHQLYSLLALMLSSQTLTTYMQATRSILYSQEPPLIAGGRNQNRIQDFADMSYNVKVDMIKTIDAMHNLFAKELYSLAKKEGVDLDIKIDSVSVTSLTKENLERVFKWQQQES